jgi:hypothetical protein
MHLVFQSVECTSRLPGHPAEAAAQGAENHYPVLNELAIAVDLHNAMARSMSERHSWLRLPLIAKTTACR